MDERELRRLARQGAEAWPELSVDEDDVVAFLAERAAEVEPGSWHPSDLFLTCACLRADAAALGIFEKRYLGLVPTFVARVTHSADQVSEVQQRLRERLLVSSEIRQAKLADYRGRGRLESWLRVVAVRAALELQRSRKPEIDADERALDGVMPAEDPELEYIRQRYAADFRNAFSAALGELEVRPRTVLRLHLVDGLNIDRIGDLYGVHRATVARWLADTRDQLYRRTRELLHRQLGVSKSEFQSLAGLIRSQLDASIRRILLESDDPDPSPDPAPSLEPDPSVD